MRLVIFLGKLNNLELWGADISNAYLEAVTEEKLYIVPGPEFEDWEGYILTFSKTLYGLKLSSRADPCIWLRENSKLNLYEYIPVYVDDLCIDGQNPIELINSLLSKYLLKVKGVGPLT